MRSARAVAGVVTVAVAATGITGLFAGGESARPAQTSSSSVSTTSGAPDVGGAEAAPDVEDRAELTDLARLGDLVNGAIEKSGGGSYAVNLLDLAAQGTFTVGDRPSVSAHFAGDWSKVEMIGTPDVLYVTGEPLVPASGARWQWLATRQLQSFPPRLGSAVDTLILVADPGSFVPTLDGVLIRGRDDGDGSTTFSYRLSQTALDRAARQGLSLLLPVDGPVQVELTVGRDWLPSHMTITLASDPPLTVTYDAWGSASYPRLPAPPDLERWGGGEGLPPTLPGGTPSSSSEGAVRV